MTLQWVSVVVFLYGELALGLLLSIGLISNARWKSILTSRICTAIASHGTFLFYSFIIMLLVLFTDSASTTYKFSQMDPTSIDLRNNPQAEIQLHMKLFRAQRNLYITGFSLFMLLVLRRLVKLTTRQAQLEASSEAAMKQARGASDQAQKLMAENEELLKNVGGGGRSAAAAEEEQKLLELVETLKEDLKETGGRLEEAERDLGTRKEQSEGLHQEYDRILIENERLEKKVSILGGGKKDD